MSGCPRRGRRRALRAGLLGLAAAHVVEALVLRRRRRGLAGLPAPDAAPTAPDLVPGTPDRTEPATGVVAVTAPGVEVGERTRAAAAREMAATGVEVMDLVPRDLPAERAVRLLRRVDPERLDDPARSPGGAQEALLLSGPTARRMGVLPATGQVQVGDRGELLRWTVRAQRYAPATAAARVAPEMRAGPWGHDDRWRELEELTAPLRYDVALPPVLVGAEAVHLAVLAAGVAASPVAGLGALAAWSAHPALVLAGRAGRAGRDAPGPELRPRDLAAATALRLPRRLTEIVGAALAGRRRHPAGPSRHSARQATDSDLSVAPPSGDRAPAGGDHGPVAEPLFERRRATCPWCGAAELSGVLDTTDLLQGKPGRFHLDECRACGHVFQNPSLSLRGLDHYYDQFYDGIGEERWEAILAGSAADNRARLRSLARAVEPGAPRAWLDVGTGHGHFCLVARHEWPGVVFDGLDMGESVEEAARRGWVDTAHRGLFPDLADGLPRSYDVVSMHHYLEHTRDPRRELAAAAKVVEPGGHLMIEVPDPEDPWARRLGRFWLCWLQPQHQHLVPCGNLVAALGEAGFEVVSVERGAATMGNDLFVAGLLAVQHLAPSPHVPWRPRLSPVQRAGRGLVLAMAVPALAVAALADQVKDRLRDPAAPGSAYRIVARRS